MNKPNLLRWLLGFMGLCVVVGGSSWLAANRLLIQPQLTSQQAAVLAMNHISVSNNGIELQNLHHSAHFTPNGVTFQATDGPSWAWQLTDATAQGVAFGSTPADRPTVDHIVYDRGSIIEQYVVHPAAIEQQFILLEPPALTAADLILTGKIQSDGTFMTTEQGWAWYTDNTTVELGNVTVYDVNGSHLPARLDVSATETRLWVDGQALATAAYPVTIDPTLAAGEVRISQSGADDDPTIDAFDPAVAYNSTNNQFMVVWTSDANADGDVTLYGATVTAATTTSFMIDNGADAYRPAITYNSTDNQFLVVWQRDGLIQSARLDNSGNVLNNFSINSTNVSLHPAVTYNSINNQYLVVWQEEVNNGEFEIVARRFSNTGTGLGKVTVSTTGTAANKESRAQDPAVTYNSTNNQYLVVWSADSSDSGDNEYQIYGQRLDHNAADVGNDFQISTNATAIQPSVSYASSSNQYMVVWASTATSVQTYNIFARRVSNSGTLPESEFQVSPATGGMQFDAAHAQVAFNPVENIFLVAWRADETTDEDHEIYVAWLDDSTGTAVIDTAAVSSMGPDGDGNYQADRPAVAYGALIEEALVVWEGDDNNGSLVDNKMEIYGSFVGIASCSDLSTANLTITTSESADPVLAGSGAENLTYVVTVTNHGPDIACNTSIAVNQTLPNDVSVASTSMSSGTSYSSPNWIIGNLPLNTPKTLTLKLTVAEAAAQATNAIAISAVATSDTSLITTNDDSDSEQTSIISNSFTVSNASITEGNSGSQLLSFTVSRTNNSIASSVQFDTANNTATVSSDYTAQSVTVNFGAGGALSQVVSVPVNGDLTVELDETFFTILSNPVNGFLATGGGQGQGTITNDDSATIAISDVTKVEGDIGQTIFTFAATLSHDVDQAVSVGYSTADGSATTADNDYVSKSSTLNFEGSAGETKNIQIAVNGDTKVEADQIFQINLNAPSSGGRQVTLTNDTVTGNMTNDDSTTVDFANSSFIIAEAGANVTLTVHLSNPSDFTVEVNYISTDGTAEAGVDYTAVSNTLIFAPGVTDQSINIPILDDGLDELDETVLLTLSNTVNANLGTSHNPTQLVIIDDEGASTVNLSSFDYHVNEADGVITVTASLSAPSGQVIEIDYVTSDDTATLGNDYTAITGTLIFPVNAISQTISISITDDVYNELAESFGLALQMPVNVNLGLVQTSTITIEDNDILPLIDFETSDFIVLEGVGTVDINVILNTLSGRDITIYYNMADHTALDGSDYTAASGSILIPTGVITGSISLDILDNATYEPTEAFTLTLTGGDGAMLTADPYKAITILDDDPLILPEITLGDVAADEGDTDTIFTFPISLSLASTFPITITYATADNSATAGADYIATNSSVVIPAGANSGNISIVVIGNMTVEPDETFTITLTSAQNGTIVDGTAVGTILNDDLIFLPEVTLGDVTATEGDTNNTFSFPITLSLASALPTTITYATADNTATVGEDYLNAANTIVIPAGVTTANIDVTVIGDVGQELDESFIVKIDMLENGILIKGTALGTILNDDTLVLPLASMSDVSATEGNVNSDYTFIVTLDMTSTLPYTVMYSTADSSATAGTDYVSQSSSVLIPAGADSATIVITVLGDTIYEPDELFTVALSGAINGYIADSVGMGTILNDDPVPIISTYLPLIMHNFAVAPDLVIDAINIVNGNVSVVIRNAGSKSVTDPFWVDLIVDPATVPAKANDTVEALHANGLVWGVVGASNSLAVGETLTLTVGDAYFHSGLSNLTGTIPAGTPIYAHVDSANSATTYGAIREDHEISNTAYNNIRMIMTSADIEIPATTSLKQRQSRSQMTNRP
jgi:hypothetical protein